MIARRARWHMLCYCVTDRLRTNERKCRCPMDDTKRRIADLRHEIGTLRAGLMATTNPLAWRRILVRANACTAELTQLVNQRLSAVIAIADEPLRERSVGETDPQ
jgi:hypothetical protein